MRQIPHPVTICLIALVASTVVACGPGTPEERVAAARAQYSVKLERFTVEEPPPAVAETGVLEEGALEEGAAAEEAAVAEAAEAAAVGAEEAAEGEDVEYMDEEAPPESGPRTVDVILHLLVRFGGDEALPGITVEVTQADPFGKEKEPTLHWIDTAGMTKSDVQQIDLEIEDVEFEDGDAFAVTLRAAVPPEQRSQYREFAEAAP